MRGKYGEPPQGGGKGDRGNRLKTDLLGSGRQMIIRNKKRGHVTKEKIKVRERGKKITHSRIIDWGGGEVNESTALRPGHKWGVICMGEDVRDGSAQDHRKKRKGIQNRGDSSSG